MNHVRTKLTIGALAIAGAVSVLAFTGVREGWVYYMPVDDFVAAADRHDQRVRLHGLVGVDRFESSPALLLARFELCGTQSRIPVEYEGVIPDMFQADREVVVEGRLRDDGVFAADILMTKCASKYESDDGEAPHADPRAASIAGAQP
jgi:cytochrome c-type biogenesis protein CcmE